MHKGFLQDYLQPNHGWQPDLMQATDQQNLWSPTSNN